MPVTRRRLIAGAAAACAAALLAQSRDPALALPEAAIQRLEAQYSTISSGDALDRALYEAAGRGTMDDVKFLISHNARPNALLTFPYSGNDPLFTALHKTYTHHALAHAIEGGHTEVAQLLLRYGADPNQPFDVPDTVYDRPHQDYGLPLAARMGLDDIVDILAESKADFHFGWQGYTALHEAARYRHKSTLIRLLKDGCDINIVGKTSDGETFGSPVLFVLLEDSFAYGLTPFKPDGLRAILGSTYNQDLVKKMTFDTEDDIFQAILDAGADVNLPDMHGRYPLHYAIAQTAPLAHVQMLLDHGAYVNAKTPRQESIDLNLWLEKQERKVTGYSGEETPLHITTLRYGGDGRQDYADLLLRYGANIEEKNVDGFTPFIQAVLEGNRIMAEFFLAKGANLFAKDNDGKDVFALLDEVLATGKILPVYGQMPDIGTYRRNCMEMFAFLTQVKDQTYVPQYPKPVSTTAPPPQPR